MVQVQFLMFQNQVNKRVNSNSILPCKKKTKTKNKQTNVCSNCLVCNQKFQMLSEDNFKIVTYPTVPSGYHNRSQRVILLVILEGKALIRPLMINKFLCQLSFCDLLSYLGQQKTVPKYHVNVMSAFFILFHVSMGI